MIVKFKCQFKINMRLPGLNEIINASRTNKYLGAKQKREVEDDISRCIAVYGLNNLMIKHPVDITFGWYEPNKKRDKDNICSAKKFILDAMVKNGVIINDGWKYINGFTDEFYVDVDSGGYVIVNIYATGED